MNYIPTGVFSFSGLIVSNNKKDITDTENVVCGKTPLDTQNTSSYTFAVKKQCLVNQYNTPLCTRINAMQANAQQNKCCLFTRATGGLDCEITLAMHRIGCRVFSMGRNPNRIYDLVVETSRIIVDPDYSTFLDPAEVAAFIVDSVSFDGTMIAEEIRLNRMVMR
jgi:hypothetical protein